VTRLICVFGAVVEGSEEELLDAVERHLAEDHSELLARSERRPARGWHGEDLWAAGACEAGQA
jgi:hypothetical protein